jgi:predicted alpha/beta hydrolase
VVEAPVEPAVETAAETADGVRLAMWRFRAAGARRAVCLVTHAMMANSGYLRRRFAPHLAARGIECFVLDWRGHGSSVPPAPGDRFGWCFDDYVELDLPAAVAQVAGEAAVEPASIAYAGHSLGGLVGLAAAATGVFSPARLALLATSLWLPGPRGSLARRGVMTGAAALARLLGRAPIRRLRLGSDDEPAAYVADLARWARTGRFTGRTGIDYEEALSRVAVPALAVTGDGDRLCLPRDAERFRSRLPGAVPLRRVGRRQGDPADPDHFSLFTLPALAPLWDEIARFLVGSTSASAQRL